MIIDMNDALITPHVFHQVLQKDVMSWSIFFKMYLKYIYARL